MEATTSTFLTSCSAASPASLPRASPRHVRVAAVAPRSRPLAVAAASTGNYVVLLNTAPSGIKPALVETSRDLNKCVPDTIIIPASRRASTSDPASMSFVIQPYYK